MTRIATILIVLLLPLSAHAAQWHWVGNTLVAEGGWEWRMPTGRPHYVRRPLVLYILVLR